MFFVIIRKGFQIFHVEQMIDGLVSCFKTISTADKESGASAMQNRSGEREAPRKILLLMLIFVDVKVPFS